MQILWQSSGLIFALGLAAGVLALTIGALVLAICEARSRRVAAQLGETFSAFDDAPSSASTTAGGGVPPGIAPPPARWRGTMRRSSGAMS